MSVVQAVCDSWGEIGCALFSFVFMFWLLLRFLMLFVFVFFVPDVTFVVVAQASSMSWQLIAWRSFVTQISTVEYNGVDTWLKHVDA